MSAEAEIKQFIDRVLRLKEEQDTLSEDIREVYAEAKGRGYDKTVLGNVVSHLRKLDKVGRDAIQEREAIFDLYLTAYETGGRAHAPARTRENIEEFPVDSYAQATLVETVAAGLQTENGRKALVAAVDIMIEREEQIDPDTGEITNSPETANETQCPVSRATGAKAEMPARSGGDDSTVRVATTEASAVTAGETAPDFEPPAFLQDKPKTARDYRPHCQNPSGCGSSSPFDHCYSCKKLIAEVAA